MCAYIVKTGDGYLYPYEGGVSFTDDENHAGHFLNTDEAHDTAEGLGYVEGSYQVIPIDVESKDLITN